MPLLPASILELQEADGADVGPVFTRRESKDWRPTPEEDPGTSGTTGNPPHGIHPWLRLNSHADSRTTSAATISMNVPSGSPNIGLCRVDSRR